MRQPVHSVWPAQEDQAGLLACHGAAAGALRRAVPPPCGCMFLCPCCAALRLRHAFHDYATLHYEQALSLLNCTLLSSHARLELSMLVGLVGQPATAPTHPSPSPPSPMPTSPFLATPTNAPPRAGPCCPCCAALLCAGARVLRAVLGQAPARVWRTLTGAGACVLGDCCRRAHCDGPAGFGEGVWEVSAAPCGWLLARGLSSPDPGSALLGSLFLCARRRGAAFDLPWLITACPHPLHSLPTCLQQPAHDQTPPASCWPTGRRFWSHDAGLAGE